MNIQSIRNLTTDRLHTNIAEVYSAIEYITGEPGVMTHMLPKACLALRPWLRQQAPEARLWDGEYDPTHTGDINIKPMNAAELSEFWKRYQALPSLLDRT